MASWTAVRVRLRGRALEYPLLGGRMMITILDHNPPNKTTSHQRRTRRSREQSCGVEGGENGPLREGGAECTASGVPGDAFGPWDLDFSQISARARPPRPFRTLGEQPPEAPEEAGSSPPACGWQVCVGGPRRRPQAESSPPPGPLSAAAQSARFGSARRRSAAPTGSGGGGPAGAPPPPKPPRRAGGHRHHLPGGHQAATSPQRPGRRRR